MISNLSNSKEVFKPYNIQTISCVLPILDENYKNNIFPETKMEKMYYSRQATTNIDEEFHQSETSSISLTKKFKKKIIIFKSFLGKKRKNSNLVKCYKCQVEDCQLLFETNNELIEHIKTHKNIITCPYKDCKYSYKDIKNFQKHYKSHSELDKKFECPFPGCGKKFTALYNQKIHYRVHTGERPYVCNICGKDYYDRANYKYHIKTSHINYNEKDVNCFHNGFCHKFKTKKIKIMHHNKLENECRKEKNNLLRLSSIYSKAINNIVNEKNIEGYLYKLKEFYEVEKQKNKVKNISLDNELYDSLFLNKNN